MSSKKRISARFGARWAILVTVLLLAVPPIVASWLPSCDATLAELRSSPELISRCGPESRIELSRWFYTYKFVGSSSNARYRGAANGKGCNVSFVMKMQGESGDWRIQSLILKD